MCQYYWTAYNIINGVLRREIAIFTRQLQAKVLIVERHAIIASQVARDMMVGRMVKNISHSANFIMLQNWEVCAQSAQMGSLVLMRKVADWRYTISAREPLLHPPGGRCAAMDSMNTKLTYHVSSWGFCMQHGSIQQLYQGAFCVQSTLWRHLGQDWDVVTCTKGTHLGLVERPARSVILQLLLQPDYYAKSTMHPILGCKTMAPLEVCMGELFARFSMRLHESVIALDQIKAGRETS